MKDLVRIFKSPEGDVYHISLSEDKGVLSQEVMETLGNVHVIYRESHSVLAALIGSDLREGFGK